MPKQRLNLTSELPTIGQSGESKPEWMEFMEKVLVPTINQMGEVIQQLDQRMMKIEDKEARPFIPPRIEVVIKTERPRVSKSPQSLGK